MNIKVLPPPKFNNYYDFLQSISKKINNVFTIAALNRYH